MHCSKFTSTRSASESPGVFSGINLPVVLSLIPIAFGCNRLEASNDLKNNNAKPTPANSITIKSSAVQVDPKLKLEADKLANLKRPNKKIIGISRIPRNTVRPDITVDLSPKEKSAPNRVTTDFILLHTTEPSPNAKSSRGDIKRHGKAHFLISYEGEIIQFISTPKVANHSGLALFDGVPRPAERDQSISSLNKFSIGIEVEGTYKKPLLAAQTVSLRKLIAFLQDKYDVPDHRVIAHTQAAIAQNQHHTVPSRGRKWCGLQYTDPVYREKIGLTAYYAYDPEVAANRVDIADFKMYAATYPKDKLSLEVNRMLQSKKYLILPPGGSAYSIAGADFDDKKTIYILPNGKRLSGNQINETLGGFEKIPPYTKIFPKKPDNIKGRA